MRWCAALTVACGGEFVDVELAMHEAVNEIRDEEGLPALVLDPALGDPARDHALDMAAGSVPLGHSGFEDRADLVRRGLPAVERVGENVAFNRGTHDPVSTAIRGWLESEQHRANIEGVWVVTGIGVAPDANGGWYFAQIFAD